MKPNGKSRLFLHRASALFAALCFSGGFASSGAEPSPATPAATARVDAPGVPLPSPHLHNLFRASDRVYSGGSPEGDEAFAELEKLGVTTIVSVDGSRPDVETARKHGLRYIHLPFGYDGVPAERIAELSRAATASPGPVYVHCHHGQHRGPAAVAVICEFTAGWTTNQAVAWLKQAGTSPDYPGLYRSAAAFHPPGAEALARVGALPEVARTSSLVESMVAIDGELERLKFAQKTGWDRIESKSGLKPVNTATILWEHFRELARSEDTAKRPGDYRANLESAVKATGHFRDLLQDPASAPAARNTAFQAVTENCSACHKKHRN